MAFDETAQATIPGGASGSKEIEIDLVEMFFTLLKRIKLIIIGTLLGALLLGAYTFFLVTPQFESTAKLYVLNSNDSVVNLSDLQIGSYLASDYQEVFKTWEVNERILQNLNLSYSYAQLQQMLTVTNPTNTRILYITVRSADAAEAALLANEYADVVREYIAETMATERPNILSTALISAAPVSPSLMLNIVIGAFIGAIVAIVSIIVSYLMDDKIKSAEDITRHAGLPTLAVIPMLGSEIPTKGDRRK